MTSKEKVEERLSDWTEDQADRALHAAEDPTGMSREERVRRHRKAMELAAATRAGQAEVDAAALIREVRDEMEHGAP